MSHDLDNGRPPIRRRVSKMHELRSTPLHCLCIRNVDLTVLAIDAKDDNAP